MSGSYIKRGIEQHGFVANEVESELILYDKGEILMINFASISLIFAQFRGNCLNFTLSGAYMLGQGGVSSVVFQRGSIPLFWSQDNPSNPRPEIIRTRLSVAPVARLSWLLQTFSRFLFVCVSVSMCLSLSCQCTSSTTSTRPQSSTSSR